MERERTNFAAWLQGIYFARAIAANFSKNITYFERPIDLDGKEERDQQNVNRFGAWAISFNRRFEEEIQMKKKRGESERGNE